MIAEHKILLTNVLYIALYDIFNYDFDKTFDHVRQRVQYNFFYHPNLSKIIALKELVRLAIIELIYILN